MKLVDGVVNHTVSSASMCRPPPSNCIIPTLHVLEREQQEDDDAAHFLPVHNRRIITGDSDDNSDRLDKEGSIYPWWMILCVGLLVLLCFFTAPIKACPCLFRHDMDNPQGDNVIKDTGPAFAFHSFLHSSFLHPLQPDRRDITLRRSSNVRRHQSDLNAAVPSVELPFFPVMKHDVKYPQLSDTPMPPRRSLRATASQNLSDKQTNGTMQNFASSSDTRWRLWIHVQELRLSLFQDASTRIGFN